MILVRTAGCRRFLCGLAIAQVASIRPMPGQVVLDAPTRAVTLFRTIDGAKEDFTRLEPQWITVSPSGAIVIRNGADRQFRFYPASDGAPVVFGRGGKGPGEFATSALTLGWVADTLWAYDPATRRITFISRSGRMLRDMPLPHLSFPAAVAPGLGGATPAAIHPDRSMLWLGISRGGQSPTATDFREQVFRTTGDGRFERIIASTRNYSLMSGPSTGPGGAVGTTRTQGIFPLDMVRNLVDVSPHGDRVVTKKTDMVSRTDVRLEIVATRRNGEIAFSRSYSLRGTPIPRSELLAAAAYISNPVFRERVVAAAPGVYAPVDRIIAGTDSVTWLQLRPTASGTPLLMLDDRGNPRFKVMIPGQKVRLAYGTATTVWVVSIGTDDFPGVLGYRVQP